MKFTKPKGAVADLHELEYISSLHQACASLRRDGSIRTDDISKFLISRYGINATEDEVADTITKGFGGGGLSEDDGEALDLCEIVALLIVPTLLKAEISLHREQMERDNIVADDNDDKGSRQFLNLASGKGGEGSYAEKIRLHNNDAWSSVNGSSRALSGEDRWPDYDIISFVLGMILKDVTGDSEPKPMTKELLKKIFLFYGEHDVAENDCLLDEMISVASGRNGNMSDDNHDPDEEEGNGMKNNEQHPILDSFMFAHCLVDDCRAYNIKAEGRLSTNYHDVFESQYDQHGLFLDKEYVSPVKTVTTFSAIDYAVDSFRSKLFVSLLWVTWALFFWAFMYDSASAVDQQCETKDTDAKIFGCRIGQGIVNWIFIMAKLVIVGSGLVMLCSIGQSNKSRNPILVVLSMGFISLMTFVPVFKQFTVLESEDGAVLDSTRPDQGEDFMAKSFITYAVFVCGILLMILAMQNLLDRIIPVSYQDRFKLLKKSLVGGTTVSMERNMKQSCAFKMNRMVRNACDIHKAAEFEHGDGSSSSKDSSYGRALLGYTKILMEREEVGGRFWAWRRLWDGKMFTEDGIWLSNKMLQGNLSQLIICLWLIPFLRILVYWINLFYESFLAVYNSDGLATYVPERWRIMVPVALAFVFGEFNSLKLASCYIPSSVKTILDFRYGTLGSLHDDEFQKLRTSVDDNSFIFGAMFWGCLFSSAFVLVTSLLVFLVLCFKEFSSAILGSLATVIGICITITMKQILLLLARRFFHDTAFYRKNPAAANVVSVILEAWNLGITTLYVLKRIVTLLAAASFFVGRIDIPFLAEGADEIGPLTLDNFPVYFRKDLLLHDAHRHPYIERIGLMYMIKLRYGDHFGRGAGTSWRLLFVFALMPWLRKYRMRSGDDVNFKREEFNFSKDGDVFQKFASLNAAGKYGRLSAKSVTQDIDLGTIQEACDTKVDDLKKEVNHLKEVITSLRLELANDTNNDIPGRGYKL